MDIRNFFKAAPGSKAKQPAKAPPAVAAAAAAAADEKVEAGGGASSKGSPKAAKRPKGKAVDPAVAKLVQIRKRQKDAEEAPSSSPSPKKKQKKEVKQEIKEEVKKKAKSPAPTPSPKKKSSSKKATAAASGAGKPKKAKELREEARARLAPQVAKLPSIDDLLESERVTVRDMAADYNPYHQGGGDDAAPPNRGKKRLPRFEDRELSLRDLTFVITATLDSLLRSECEDLIKRHGGRVTGSVSGKTDFLVAGTDCGSSKIKSAKEKTECVIITEDGLISLLPKLSKEKEEEEEANARKQQEQQEQERQKAKAAAAAAAADSPAPMAIDSAGGGGDLWVTKHKPKTTDDVVGNQANMRTLALWLRTWNRTHLQNKPPPQMSAGKRELDLGKKAVLLSGPPGIGKTTTAQLLAERVGFGAIEVNASDTRGKSDGAAKRKHGLGGKMSNQIREMITNSAICATNPMSRDAGARRPPLLIMDECDGMSGSDRGGIGEIVDCIKNTKIPIICICNDKHNQKMKPLKNVCLELDFRRPTKQQVAKRMLAICQEEGLQTDPVTLETLAEMSNGDLRMLLGHLQQIRLTKDRLTYDDVRGTSGGSSSSSSSGSGLLAKDADLSPFAVASTLLGFEGGHLSIPDQTNLMFQDMDLIPLLIQENYVNHRPKVAGSDRQRMQIVAKAADGISCGDLASNMMRGEGEWSLMPFVGVMSGVFPANYVRGAREVFGIYPGEGNFPRFAAWLGNNSSTNKNMRLQGDLANHLRCGGGGQALSEYLNLLRLLLTKPLVEKGKEGIEDILQVMQSYGLTKEDREYLLTGASYKNFPPAAKGAKKQKEPAVPTAVKSALTRRLNALGMNTDDDGGFKRGKKQGGAKAGNTKGKAKAKAKAKGKK